MKIIYDPVRYISIHDGNDSFDWKNYKKHDADSYFRFEKWSAREAIQWCDDLELSYKILDHEWAMQIVFDFKHDKEAVWFILRWMNPEVIDRVCTTNDGKWIL